MRTAHSLSELELTKYTDIHDGKNKSYVKMDYKKKLYDCTIEYLMTLTKISSFIWLKSFVEYESEMRNLFTPVPPPSPYPCQNHPLRDKNASPIAAQIPNAHALITIASSLSTRQRCARSLYSAPSTESQSPLNDRSQSTVEDLSICNQDLRVHHRTGGDNEEQTTDMEVQADWFKKLERPPTPDLDWSKRRQVDFQPLQTWIHQVAHVEETFLLLIARYTYHFMCDFLPRACINRHSNPIKILNLTQEMTGSQPTQHPGSPKSLLNSLNLRNKTAYTSHSDPYGIIYVDQFKRKRLMRTDEHHKFSDGMLNDVRTALHDIAEGIRMEYLPGNRYSLKDKNEAKTNKTEHENRKSVKSQSQKIKVKVEAKDVCMDQPAPKLMGQLELVDQLIKSLFALVKSKGQGYRQAALSDEVDAEYKDVRCQNRRDLPRDIPLDSVVVLRYEKRSKSKNKGRVPTKMELVLEQTQQGSSYEVSVSAEGVEELKRKVKINGEKKEALLTLRHKPSQYICCRESQR
ncbi:hypothetical protein Tco_1377687 [Tanacetum coccineum]